MPDLTRADVEAIVVSVLARRSKTVERVATVSAVDPLTVSLSTGEAFVTLTDPTLVLAVGDKVKIDWVGTGYMVTGLAGPPSAPTAAPPPAAHTHEIAQITDYAPPDPYSPAYGGFYRSTDQNFTDSATSKVTWDTEDVDTDGEYTLSSGEVTVATGGTYLIEAQLSWTSTAGGRRRVFVETDSINAGAESCYAGLHASESGEVTTRVTTVMRLSADDKVWCEGYQTSGGDLTINCGGPGSPFDSRLTLTRIGEL